MREAENTDVRHAELLDAAAHLFASKGFHATAMRGLAQQLKIKAGSLYYHIDSKEQLLSEVCEIGMNEVSLNIDRAVATCSDFPAMIRSIVVGHAGLIKRYGNYLICYQNEYIHLGADDRERMRLKLVTFHRKIDDIFARAIANGEARPNLHIRDARLALISFLQQLSRLGTEHSQASLEQTAEGLAEILIHGVGRERASGSPSDR